jgi:hypothetical protein
LIKQLRLIIKSIKENRLKKVKIEFYSRIRRKGRNDIVKISNYSIA